MIFGKKVKCHTCGHFNMIRTDYGWLKGCSVFSLMLEEMRNEFEEKDGTKTDVTIAPIDSKFLLNKDGDCEFWTEQSPEQRQAVLEIKKWRRKNFLRNIMNKFRRSNGRSEPARQSDS